MELVMNEKIGNLNHQVVSINLEPPRRRQTANNDFGSVMARGAGTALNVIGGGAKAVAPFVPGGAFITAVADVATGAGAALGQSSPLGSGGDKWKLLQAQSNLQDEGLSNSLQLLALQRRMQQENQAFTAMSNVMKARHEMSKAAISNIR